MLTDLYQKVKKHHRKILATVSFVAAGYCLYYAYNNDKTIRLSTFFDALHNKQIQQVIFKGNLLYFRSDSSEWYHTVLGSYPLYDLFNILKGFPEVSYSCQMELLTVANIVTIGSPIVLIGMMYKLMPENFGKGIYKKKTNGNESFEYFYSGQKVRNFLKETMQFMKSPQICQKNGLRPRRGILLHGPPGTGKTLLARILANQSGLQYFATSASEFNQIYVGVGAKRIRQIFQKARLAKQGAIIFIDQIDAIGSRGDQWQNGEHRATINQLLTEMDGFSQNQRVFIVGATNNIALLDKALIRPGRFDLKIHLPLPDFTDRYGILKTKIKNKSMFCQLKHEHLTWVAGNSEGWSGAEIENLVNESGYAAIHNGEKIASFETVKSTLFELNKKSGE